MLLLFFSINRKFHQNVSLGMFHEYDKKGRYKSKRKDPPKELIREGLKELKNEIKLWKSEWKERLMCDPIMAPPDPGITLITSLLFFFVEILPELYIS